MSYSVSGFFTKNTDQKMKCNHQLFCKKRKIVQAKQTNCELSQKKFSLSSLFHCFFVEGTIVYWDFGKIYLNFFINELNAI
jgi:hypothetical protein